MAGQDRSMTGSALWRAIAVAAALIPGACTVGPDFRPPAAPPAGRYTAAPLAAATAAAATRSGQAQHFIQGEDIPGDWWTLFRSAALDALVERALRDNPDIEAAQAALRQASENLYAREGALFPSAAAALQGSRQRLSGASFGQPNFNPTFTLVTASVQISYAPDVFGGIRRQIESLAAQAEQRDFELEATYLTLSANVVVAAIQEAALRGQIQAMAQIQDIEGSEVDLVRRRFAAGVVSQADVLLQEAALDRTRASVPPLQKQLAQVRNRLSALIGQLPDREPDETFDLDGLKLPLELPVSLPSQLIEQRPDVREARAQLHSASATLGVAIANQLPQFALTAGGGGESGSLDAFPGVAVWNIGAGISQSLFDAGQLLHKKRAARAALDASAAQYRSTVIRAFQNVSDVLRALRSDADALAAAAAAERSAFASLEVARNQLHAETADELTVLLAERSWQQARLDLVQTEADRFVDTAALFQALGGGWWHRNDAAPKTPAPTD
jgi:NodT family efflux transporter outer membrane factor (OMF) lipoprotein